MKTTPIIIVFAAALLLDVFPPRAFGDDILYQPGMNRGGLERRGLYPPGGPMEFRRVRWKLNIPFSTSPVLSNGMIYFGGTDEEILHDRRTGRLTWKRQGENTLLYAADAKTGEVRWKFQTKGLISSSLTVSNGVVYVGIDEYLYAIDVETNEPKWKFATGKRGMSSPAVFEGTVYFGSKDHHLYAVDAETGKQKWKFKTGEGIESSPAISNGMVFVGSLDKHLYAVDAETGLQKWKFQADFISSTPAVHHGVVYFGSKHFHAVDVRTGKEKWRFELDEHRAISDPSSTAVTDDAVYFRDNEDRIYAVDIQTGKEKWTLTAGRGGAPSVADGVVYFPDTRGRICNFRALDVETGKPKWKLELEDFEQSHDSPIIWDGVIYFGTDDGLYAIE